MQEAEAVKMRGTGGAARASKAQMELSLRWIVGIMGILRYIDRLGSYQGEVNEKN